MQQFEIDAGQFPGLLPGLRLNRFRQSRLSHHGRHPCRTARRLSGHGRDLPVSVQRTSPRAWGLRQREAPHPQAICAARMLLSGQLNGVSTPEFDPFIAVGTKITPRPPHSPERALLTHSVLTLSV
jgi:hypothetical protein